MSRVLTNHLWGKDEGCEKTEQIKNRLGGGQTQKKKKNLMVEAPIGRQSTNPHKNFAWFEKVRKKFSGLRKRKGRKERQKA